MGFKINDITLKHGLMLAPMAGVTDRSFRRICLMHGAEFAVSEMVSAKALCYEQRGKKKDASATAELATVYEQDSPMSIQIFGSEPEFMAEAAKMLQDGSYKGCRSTARPVAIDINMGCPVRKITGNGEGSALMKDPALAGRIAEAVVKSVDIPVTVKIRAGWDSDSINAVEIAKILESAGVSAICVHARTREQLYSPGIDLGVIADVKKSVRIPVIGNGDIFSATDAIKMFEETECDGIMIGRGAMGNPWLFGEIISALDKAEYIPPTTQERIDTAIGQLDAMLLEYGERTGVAQAKKHMAWYISGMRGSTAARGKIMTANSAEEIKNVLFDIAESQN